MISEKGKVEILEKYIDREKTQVNYTDEMSFYNLVKNGRKEEVKKVLEMDSFAENTRNPLSDNPLQSLKYHLVVTAAMVARFCVEGGMEYHRAYELSDYYIRKADRAVNEKEIAAIQREMCMEYTKSMNRLQKKMVFSKQITQSIDYIYSHLHCRITVPEIAEYVRLNESYFSRLFSREVGMPVSRYILIRKIEAAQNLLKYSQYSCCEISELLSFSSQSHFIARFHSICGMTPLEYRNKYYNHTGLNSEI